MNTSLRLIVFAHARSGSSSLYEILQSHPQLHILEEPFNEGFTSWNPGAPDYLELITDIPSLDQQLDAIFQSYNGVKVLDYQLPESLYVHMLQRPDCKIIFLRRNNLLQAVVSVLIAEQTNLWKKWEMDRPIHEYYARLAPLSLSDIHDSIAAMRQGLAFYDAVISALPADRRLKLVYEDLYLGTPAMRADWLARIWRFLGLDPISSDTVQRYLDPEQAKINSRETYQFLPNAREINQRLGNDETGWLW